MQADAGGPIARCANVLSSFDGGGIMNPIHEKPSVMLCSRGYQGVVTGYYGGRAVYSQRTGIVRQDIMRAYHDALCRVTE